MIKSILTLAIFFIAGMLFTYIRSFILSKFSNMAKSEISEKFDVKKFKKMFVMFDGVEWIKSIKEIIDIRKLTIYILIIGIIFAYGWYKGKQDTPVKLDIGYDKEAIIELSSTSQLHITKKGYVYLEDEKGNKLKQISVKDIPNLKKKLSPIGFELTPIGIIGYGTGQLTDTGIEAGAGIRFLRFWKGRLETFLTNKGAYIGTSYKLDILKMKNSAIGGAYGKGWKEMEDRIILYFSIEF